MKHTTVRATIGTHQEIPVIASLAESSKEKPIGERRTRVLVRLLADVVKLVTAAEGDDTVNPIRKRSASCCSRTQRKVYWRYHGTTPCGERDLAALCNADGSSDEQSGADAASTVAVLMR